MVGYLLDTHVLLCWMSDPDRLSAESRAVIAERSNRVYVSAATGWEIGIKQGLGRLSVPDQFTEAICNAGIEILPVFFQH